MPLYLLFGVHNHQPLGNFPWVFEEVAQKAYRPFLQTLREVPSLKVSLHLSGPLLQWCEAHDPAYLDLTGSLIDVGLVEPLCAGFYEPVLAALPKEDRRGQVEMMREYLHRRFGVWPRGLWLTERVWEASLVEDLCQVGVEYVLVDDRHFLTAGFSPEALHAYYLTEEGGHRLAIFPIAERLRLHIPFRPAGEVGEHLRDLSRQGQSLAIYADDGEKFGAWPHTFAWIYEKGWLRQFLEMIGNLGVEGILPLTFGQALHHLPPAGICYLPTASYVEMEEWALPPERAWELRALKAHLGPELPRYTAFIRGGHWRNFFARYPESNRMHKTVLHLSRQLRSQPDISPAVQREVYAAQCNDAYWHGIFGGLYLPHLRHEIWRRIARAERMLRAREELHLSAEDLDLDGKSEVLASSSAFSSLLAPHRGGQLLTYTHFTTECNYLNTLSRRQESYHAEILRAGGGAPEVGRSLVPDSHDPETRGDALLAKALIYDRHLRGAFLDHLFSEGARLEQFRRAELQDLNEVEGPYRWQVQGAEVILERTFALQSLLLRLQKTFTFTPEGAIQVHYTLTNTGNQEATCRFGVEWNLFPAAIALGEGVFRVGDQEGPLEEESVHEEVQGFVVKDQPVKGQVEVKWDRPAVLWRFPVWTVSQSEQGFERTLQAIALMAHFPLNLPPQREWRTTFRWEIRPSSS